MRNLILSLFAIVILSPLSVYSQNKWASDEEALSIPQNWDDLAITEYVQQKSVKKRITVIPFDGNKKLEEKINANLADLFTAELGKSNIFEMIERKQLEKILEEQNFQMSGVINDEAAIQAGNLLGAEYLVTGSVTNVAETKEDKFAYDLLTFEVGVSVRVLDISSGKVLLTEKADGKAEAKIITTSSGETISGSKDNTKSYLAATTNAVKEVVAKIKSVSPVVGIVLKKEDKKNFLLDCGTEKGVQKNMYFLVVRLGSEIIHPVTKKSLGWNKQVLALVQVKDTQKSFANATLVLTNDDIDENEIKENDIVILKQFFSESN